MCVQGQDELFEKYDEDNNERLNPIEFGKFLNEKMKGMRGGKGKDTNDDFSANSMPNLEIFKGIDTNKDGEIDDDEFEAQRELFDFLGRMPNLDEDDEELDEKEIVDRLVEESVREMGNEKMEKDKSENQNEKNENTSNDSKNLNKSEDSDKCSKENGQCSVSKEDEIIEEGLEDNKVDSLDKKTEL
uniref:EF-hand domain-containing protein n=1 Tax=Meloidogyne floridensis TaxID=298350 RepID=A0A915PD07_9BILA